MSREEQKHALRQLGKVLLQDFGLGETFGSIFVLRREEHLTEEYADTCGIDRTDHGPGCRKFNARSNRSVAHGFPVRDRISPKTPRCGLGSAASARDKTRATCLGGVARLVPQRPLRVRHGAPAMANPARSDIWQSVRDARPIGPAAVCRVRRLRTHLRVS